MEFQWLNIFEKVKQLSLNIIVNIQKKILQRDMI